MNLARQQTLADLSSVALAKEEQRENGRRGYELAVHCERWNLLKGMYAESRKARRGQRRCWLALRQHASMMLEKGI